MQINHNKISFIGMSNIGKTYWSQTIEAELGYYRLCCDEWIEERLGGELKELGYSGIADMAKWMGQPYDKQFEQTQKTYLDLEVESIDAGIKHLDSYDKAVVDTTGSFAHLSLETRNKLKEQSVMIYIEASDEHIEDMFKSYFEEPKPVCWGEVFNQKDGESDIEALKRCYPELIKYRSARYKESADITIPVMDVKRKGTQNFVDIVNNAIAKLDK